MSVAGRAGRIEKSDARAQGTNPRFPWKPSATMLTYRLTGTTEAIGVDHDEPAQSRPATDRDQQQQRGAESSRTMVRPKTAPRC